jgi:hypothetical protein
MQGAIRVGFAQKQNIQNPLLNLKKPRQGLFVGWPKRAGGQKR